MTTAAEELQELLEAEQEYRAYNKLDTLFPDSGPFAREHYPKHMKLFEAGAEYKLRAFIGGNGVGKTLLGATEATYHATGRYPDWWPGARFPGPVAAWICGKTRETVRDIIQAKLIGDVAKRGESALGTGTIPRIAMGKPRFIQNTNYACDYIPVAHVSGGTSVVGFKAYEQGRDAFEGVEQHFILLDEEPPEDVHEECIMRTRTVNGIVLLTFTPLRGYSKVVKSYLDRTEGDSRFVIHCGWKDVPHLSDEEKQRMRAATRPHLRKAREEGIPTAGVGMVYPIEEDQFVIRPIELPPHFRRVFGFDGGWHNTAACWLAYDKDEDVAYLYSEYKRGEQQVSVHAAALRARGDWIPGVGDASARGQHDGKKVLGLYHAEGVKLRLADKSVDVGIQDIYDRLCSGRLKIFSTCVKTLEEMRMYRYNEKGDIIKDNDHLMDSLRYAIRTGLKIATTRKLIHVHIPTLRFG